MSKARYWLLNMVWQVVMFASLQLFYLYESVAFNYSNHYVAFDLWLTAAITSLFYALLYFFMLSAGGMFWREPKGRKHGN